MTEFLGRPVTVIVAMDEVAAIVGAVWDTRCGTQRNDLVCETCAAFTDLCAELGIDPPPPHPEADDR